MRWPQPAQRLRWPSCCARRRPIPRPPVHRPLLLPWSRGGEPTAPTRFQSQSCGSSRRGVFAPTISMPTSASASSCCAPIRSRERTRCFVRYWPEAPATRMHGKGGLAPHCGSGIQPAAIGAGRRAMSLAPGNIDLRRLLNQFAPDWDRPRSRGRARPASLQLVARTRGRQFEIKKNNAWQPLYLQGVNLGVALPGKYPSEFPTDSARYRGWLDTLAAMNDNTLRLYTILPPAFYRALRGWNLTHPDRPLLLVHGVWTELPPGDAFDDGAWQGGFHAEIRWHNVMDAEQNYGILGHYAGDALATPRLGGDPARWRALSPVQKAHAGTPQGLRALGAGADESFYYLALELDQGKFPWISMGIQIAIDTYLPSVGQHRLPRSRVQSELGFEFLIDLAGPNSGRLLITPDYNRHASMLDSATGDDYGRFARRPAVTRDRSDGRFDSLFVITNRARFGRDGTFFPAGRHDRGVLRHGTEAGSTLADWYLDERAGCSRFGFHGICSTSPTPRVAACSSIVTRWGTVKAADFHTGVLLYRKGDRPGVVGALPSLEQGVWRAARFTPWRWPSWTEPRSHARLKPVYDSIREVWRAAPSRAPVRPGRRVPSN